MRKEIIKKDINSYIKNIELSGIGTFNNPFEVNLKNKGFNEIVLPSNNGKTTIIKSILFTIFNQKFEYFKSFKPYNDFYGKIKFSINNNILNIINKGIESNLEQEINNKINDKFVQEEVKLYFNLLNNLKEEILINPETLNKKSKLLIRKNLIEEFKEKNKNLKIEKIKNEFYEKMGYYFHEDIEKIAEEKLLEQNNKIQDIKKDLVEIKNLLKRKQELSVKKENLLKELKELENEINKKELESIYKEIDLLLKIFNKYKEKKTSINIDTKKLKVNMEKLIEDKFDELLNIEKEVKNIMDKIIEEIKNIDKFRLKLDEKIYNKINLLLKEIYKLIIKLEEYEEIEIIINDIKELLRIKEEEPEKFNIIFNLLEKLENIYLSEEEENEEKLEEIFSELLNSKIDNKFFINLIKRYQVNILFFISLIENLKKFSSIKKEVVEQNLFKFMLSLFNINNNDNAADDYLLVIESSQIINSIEYSVLKDILDQFIDTIKDNTIKEVKELERILREKINNIILKSKTEILEYIEKSLKESNSSEINNNDNKENIKEKLQKLINYKHVDKEKLMKNDFNIKVLFFDEVELKYYQYLSNLVNKKEFYESRLSEHITKTQILKEIEIEIAKVKENIKKILEKYIKIFNDKLKKENYPPEMIRDVEKKLKEKINNEIKNLKNLEFLFLTIKQSKKEAKKLIEDINKYYSQDKYKILLKEEEVLNRINNLIDEVLPINKKFLIKDNELFVQIKKEEEEILIPLEIETIYTKLIFKIFNLIIFNEYLLMENKNLFILIDDIDKELTNNEKKELLELLKIISKKYNIQIIITHR